MSRQYSCEWVYALWHSSVPQFRPYPTGRLVLGLLNIPFSMSEEISRSLICGVMLSASASLLKVRMYTQPPMTNPATKSPFLRRHNASKAQRLCAFSTEHHPPTHSSNHVPATSIMPTLVHYANKQHSGPEILQNNAEAGFSFGTRSRSSLYAFFRLLSKTARKEPFCPRFRHLSQSCDHQCIHTPTSLCTIESPKFVLLL